MKYLIISAEELENKIQQIIDNNKYVYEDNEYMEEHYPIAFELKHLLLTEKQVDLSEDNLEELAEGYAAMYLSEDPKDEDSSRRKHGYKQALKDLL